MVIDVHFTHHGHGLQRTLRRQQVHAEKTLQCLQCTSKFSTQGHLNAHVKGVHGNKKRKRVQRGAVKRVQLRELDQGPLVSAAGWAKANGWVHSC